MVRPVSKEGMVENVEKESNVGVLGAVVGRCWIIRGSMHLNQCGFYYERNGFYMLYRD